MNRGLKTSRFKEVSRAEICGHHNREGPNVGRGLMSVQDPKLPGRGLFQSELPRPHYFCKVI